MGAVVRPAISPYGHVAGLATWKVGGWVGGAARRGEEGAAAALRGSWEGGGGGERDAQHTWAERKRDAVLRIVMLGVTRACSVDFAITLRR